MKDLTAVSYIPKMYVLNAEQIEAVKKVGRLLQGGDSSFPTPVGGVILGPVLVAKAYPTVRNGWARDIKCSEGEALVRTSKGSAYDFACWRVVPVSMLPEEAVRAAA